MGALEFEGSRTPHRTGWWAWALLIAMVGYVAVGVLPVRGTSPEGDGLAIAAASEHRASADLARSPIEYRYSFQPLPYALATAGKRTLGVDAPDLLAWWTVAAGASFLICGALLSARVGRLGVGIGALGLLLFQETWVCAAYANTTTMAAGFLAPGLLATTLRSRRAAGVAGVLFALAATTRFDALAMAPLVGVLCLCAGRGWVVRALVVTGAFVAAFVGLCAGLGVSFSLLMREIALHEGQSETLALANYLSILTAPVCLLGALGAWRLWSERAWGAFGALAACGVLVAAYGLAMPSPKYMLYALPIGAAFVGAGIVQVGETRRARVPLVAALFVAVAAQFGWGLARVARLVHPTTPVIFRSVDGPRRLGSVAMVPLDWRRLRAQTAEHIDAIGALMDERLPASGRVAWIADSYWARSVLVLALLERGFELDDVRFAAYSIERPRATFWVLTFRDGAREADVIFIRNVTSPEEARDVLALLPDPGATLVFGRPDRVGRHFPDAELSRVLADPDPEHLSELVGAWSASFPGAGDAPAPELSPERDHP